MERALETVGERMREGQIDGESYKDRAKMKELQRVRESHRDGVNDRE